MNARRGGVGSSVAVIDVEEMLFSRSFSSWSLVIATSLTKEPVAATSTV